jgi:hypothetical protein
VKLTLPGGVSVEWTRADRFEAVRILLASLETEDSARPAADLVLANPNIVRYDDRHARLTATQHAILRYVLSRGPAPFGDLQDSVWLGRQVSDATIRRECSRASTRLLEADIPYELSAAGGCVSLSPVKEI